jgi:DNA-binding CsgD family transcriptional regulator
VSRSEETTDIVRPRGAASMRATQVFGLCFYWAWVYLSFNTTSSINLSISSDQSLLWVHLASMLAGVAAYALIVAFARDAVSLFSTRRALLVAGLVMSVGTACYALPLALPLPVMVAGAALSGVASCWIVIYWGTLYSQLSARNIVLCTAAAFFCGNVIYFGSLLLPFGFPGAITTLLPLCAAVLIPDTHAMRSYLGDAESVAHAGEWPASEAAAVVDDTKTADSGKAHAAGGHQMMPFSRLPWRIALGLFVVMFVYGGVRVFIGVSDSTASDGLLPTVLLTFGVTILFIVWGFFFQGENASLGTVYKIMLPMLSTALLLMAIFGQEYVSLMAVLATVCNITIEILSWMLLADIARTTRVPAFLVFAIGRLAVQAGMFGGQLTGWMCVGYIVPFAVVSIFALMLVMGFMFKDQDTLMVFEAPTPDERQNVEKLAGRSMDEHLAAIADAHGLTQREKEIFVLWATGHGSKYIQDTFTISAPTVKTHVRHIYEKCGVHSRAEVIALLEQSR